MTQKPLLNPLTYNIPIADAHGNPTPEFMRKWSLQTQINASIIDLSTAAAVSGVLDKLGSTAGDILIRSASAWTVAVMSGDVTISTTGVTTIGNAKVSYAKIQNVTDARLLGRSSGSAGPPMEITVGTGLSLSSGALTCTVTGGVSVTGSPVSGNLTKFSGASSITNGDLSGDVTTSGALATTIKSGVTLSGNPTTTTQSTGDNSTRIATTAYVTTAIANAIAGVNPAQAVEAATTSASDTSSFVYSNGASGIGATLTGPTANTAVTIDGYTFTAVGQRLLVKNDTQSPSGAFNGVYYLTTLQAPLIKPVFTRALDYDQSSDINETGAIPVKNGTINALTSWLLTSLVTAVGTDPLTYVQFSYAPVTAANPTATASDTAVNGSATSYMRSDAAPKVQKASDTAYGIVKYDNSSITLNGSNQLQASPGPTIGTPIRPPGYVTGRVYYPPSIIDTFTTGSRATGTIWALPFCVTSAHTFTGIGITTSGATAVNAELGVYADSGAQPGALVQDCGQVSLNTGTAHTLTVNIPLTPGWYWLAISVSGTVTIDVLLGSMTAFLQGSASATNTGPTSNIPTVAWTYSTGNLPNPFGTPTYVAVGAPAIYLVA